MMPFVEKVYSSLKGGCDVQLGAKTLLVGPNGGGKSTIVQSIELATRGCVSDAEGRAFISNVQGLARLFGEAPFRAEVVLSDGTEYAWSTKEGAKDGSYRAPVHVAPRPVSWPVQDIEAVLAGDSNTVAAWLEKQVIGEMTVDALLKMLPPEVRAEVKALVTRQKKIDFIALAKEARTEAKALRARATKNEGLIEKMLEGISPPLLETERAQYEAELAALPQHGVTRMRYDRQRQEVERLMDRYIELSQNIVATPESAEQQAVAADKFSTALQLITQHEQKLGLDDCWVCGSDSSLARHKEVVMRALTKLRPWSRTTRSALFQEQQLVEAQLTQAAEDLRAMVVFDPVERDVIVRKLAEDSALQKTWLNAESSRLEVAQLRARADHLTTAAKSLETVGKDMIDRMKRTFETKVQSFLPSGDEFSVDLASSRVGLVRDGQLHSALSGAEWTRVLLALASTSLSDSTPSVLAPRDRAWDPDTLSSVMIGLSEAPGQIILMSTVPPSSTPSGWTVITLG